MLESHEQSHRDRLARAYQSLEGLCCGDAFGERFFIREEMLTRHPRINLEGSWWELRGTYPASLGRVVGLPECDL